MLNFQELPIDSLSPSPTNPRKRFNEKELQDLAASIKEKGVMQPILARPMPGLFESYEIVAGERRWRASKLAGLETIPATVRELDDIETLQLQIIENMQRSDLHPLEEAQALQNMLQATGSNGHKQWTHEELGTKIGKSRSYVFASLNLLKLSNFAKDKFLEDKFGRETALLVSRVPGEKLQEKLVTAIVQSELSYRAAKDYIHRDFTFDLTKATWDKFDETVLAETPSCAKCPKRSGNYPELHPDIESPDVCTDPTCYSNKKAAYADRVIKTMPRVIHGDEAKQVAPYGYDYFITNGYVRSLDKVEVDGFNAAEILGDDAPEPFKLVDEKKNINLVYQENEVITLVKEKLAEKIASGELQPPKTQNPPGKSRQQLQRERQEPIAAQINENFRNYLKTCLQIIDDQGKTEDCQYQFLSFINTRFADFMEYNGDLDFFYETFNTQNLTPQQMLISILCLDLVSSLEIGIWDLNDNDELEEDEDREATLNTLKNLTGVAPPPLPAAQAQELTPEPEAPEPVAETPAANATPTVETSEPADTPTPAPLDAEKAAEAARFAAIREKAEAKRARKAAKKSQKESAQADA
ncbi:ParB/RepB/Spo0J family partition protein [Methylophilus sp. VKM B-3414]|uniref:ParB/RepB/Spo0J family partition protein n=1 Tax=Methylophilus sp. VKM B-3414 TaxID=3076121 RepID=UPI0028C92908|nr:ParB/RepB/Spo0J family partition protein [Methylophilus sp. VKM B-3414]MDT7849949.1 ParB/RepB/Spo0J family partition protein [Methylophilus sp. VKM B-3414]